MNNPAIAREILAVASAHAAARPTLEVQDLHVAFRTQGAWRPVVEKLSFHIHPGETLAIVGESGSGKSVTALAILGLLDPYHSRVRGQVHLEGQALLTLPESALRKVRGRDVAMVFQEPMTSLNPVLTIGTQLAEVLVYHRGIDWTAARTEAIRLLDRMRIAAPASRYDDYPHRLSGGMRQRVMIAMALACQPKLLIADEPTTALDVTIQAQILDLIRELQAQDQTSVLFITHDMGVVAEVADRTLVMRHGNAVETGYTEDLFLQPRHPYTRALLGAVPRLGEMRGQLQPQPMALVDADTGVPMPTYKMPDTVVATGAPLLQLQGLTTRFDLRSGWLGRVTSRVHAVEDVSLEVRAGETLALVGESGSGKSTIGRSILGLVKAQAGSVHFDGHDLTALSGKDLRAQRRRIQMIFQDPFGSLDPRQTVGSALAEPLAAHRLATGAEMEDRVASLLTQVGLQPEMASRYPHEFSGGQRQRICIARALALEPRLIIADEAVSALDVSIKAQIVNLMLQLQEQLGLAYLFISHDLSVVERISHRVAVLYLGEVVETGPRNAIFTNPQHPYTRRLLAAVPQLDPAQRRNRHNIGDEELRTAVRAPDYIHRPVPWRQVSEGHWVRESGGAPASA